MSKVKTQVPIEIALIASSYLGKPDTYEEQQIWYAHLYTNLPGSTAIAQEKSLVRHI